MAEAPGTFRERSGKFVYWNFRSVDILPFTTPSSAPRSPCQPVFFLYGSYHRLGWGWEARLLVLWRIISYIKPEIPVSERPPSGIRACNRQRD